MNPPANASVSAGASAGAIERVDPLWRALLDHGPFMVIAIDERYRIVSINRVVEGMRVEDVLGTSALDYMPPENHVAVRAAIDSVLGSGVAGQFETGGRVADGSFGWWVTHVLPVAPGAEPARALLLTTEVTATRRAEAALRASEERLRHALEAAEEGLWDWNMESDVCYFSPAYHAMLGYPPGAIGPELGDAQGLLHPDDVHVVTQGPRLLRDPGQFTMRFRMRSASGDYRWIESRGKTVQRDAAGQPMRAVGTHIDITERLRLEDALRRNEALLRSIVEGTTDCIFVKDRQGRYLLVNQALCAVVGRSADELLGQDASVFLPPEAAGAMRTLDLRLMDDAQVVSVNETLSWIAGQQRSFHTTKGPLLDDGGQVVGMFGISRDVTELLRHEEAQRRAVEDSRSLLDLALAGAELGTWDVDLIEGTARYDERYLALLGYDRTEMPTSMEAWWRLLHPDDAAAVREAIRAHAAGETRAYESEHRLRHKNGHWVWMLARGKVLRNESGEPIRSVGTVLDITDRKRMATEGAALLRKVEALIRGLDPRGAADAGPRPAAEPAASHRDRLSGRSREVLGLLAAGHTAAEIAERLGISRETANTHRRNLMRKLGLRNKAELIRYAIENGIGLSTSSAAGP